MVLYSFLLSLVNSGIYGGNPSATGGFTGA